MVQRRFELRLTLIPLFILACESEPLDRLEAPEGPDREEEGEGGMCPRLENPGGCRSNTDCGAATCVLDVPLNCGGADRPPELECERDADCAGRVCEFFPGRCPGDASSRCVPPCSASSCPDGERCGAGGHCEPILCSEGFICSDTTICDPGRALSDEHGCRPLTCSEGFVCAINETCAENTGTRGCARITCDRDADCACGACVNDACSLRLGTCWVPPPVAGR
jgi:hypothetical protein